MAPRFFGRGPADSADALVEQAVSAALHGDAAEARRLGRRAEAQTRDPALLIQLAEAFQRVLSDYDEAERYYLPAAEAGSPKALAELGVIHFGRRAYRESEMWLRRAVAAEPTGYAMLNLGHALYGLGAREEALLYCRRAAEVGEFGADHMVALLEQEQREGPASPGR